MAENCDVSIWINWTTIRIHTWIRKICRHVENVIWHTVQYRQQLHWNTKIESVAMFLLNSFVHSMELVFPFHEMAIFSMDFPPIICCTDKLSSLHNIRPSSSLYWAYQRIHWQPWITLLNYTTLASASPRLFSLVYRKYLRYYLPSMR